MISIVVPIYNVENYLRDCIESVFKQSFGDWELILVDDGSNDKSPVICDEYARKDKRVKVVHKTNGGLVSARKAGLEVASGNYVMPLDGDDFIEESCLEKVDEQIGNNCPDVICFGYNIFFEGHIKPNPIEIIKYGQYSRDDLEKYVFPSFLHGKDESQFPHNQWAKVFRRDIYTKYQNAVPSEIGMGEDGACTYPLIFNSKSIIILRECLYYYRQVTSSMTKIKKPLSWDNYDMLYRLYEKEIDLTKFDMQQQYYRARTHNLFNIVLSQFYKEKAYGEIVSAIKYRFSEHPEYDEAIMNSDFSSFSMKMCRYLLNNKLYIVFYLISSHKAFLKRMLSFK